MKRWSTLQRPAASSSSGKVPEPARRRPARLEHHRAGGVLVDREARSGAVEAGFTSSGETLRALWRTGGRSSHYPRSVEVVRLPSAHPVRETSLRPPTVRKLREYPNRPST